MFCFRLIIEQMDIKLNLKVLPCRILGSFFQWHKNKNMLSNLMTFIWMKPAFSCIFIPFNIKTEKEKLRPKDNRITRNDIINSGDNPAHLEWLSVNSKPELRSKFIWKFFSAKKNLGNIKIRLLEPLTSLTSCLMALFESRY